MRHRRSAQAGLVPTRAMCSWHSVRAATDLSADQVDSELKASVIKVAEAKVRGAKELSEVWPEAASRPMCDDRPAPQSLPPHIVPRDCAAFVHCYQDILVMRRCREK